MHGDGNVWRGCRRSRCNSCNGVGDAFFLVTLDNATMPAVTSLRRVVRCETRVRWRHTCAVCLQCRISKRCQKRQHVCDRQSPALHTHSRSQLFCTQQESVLMFFFFSARVFVLVVDLARAVTSKYCGVRFDFGSDTSGRHSGVY